MFAAPKLAPALPVFPLAALPSDCLTTSTTNSLLAANSRLGGGGVVAMWQAGRVAGNSRKALGLPVCLYDSGGRSRSTGKERDAKTGLDYSGYRYMSSAQGRFTSPDPDNFDARLEQPQSWNMYPYTWNNPLKYRDDDGRAVNVGLAFIGAGVGFGTGFVGSAVSQYIQDGSVDWGTATAYGAGGAVSGATAGLTFGGSLVAQAVAGIGVAAAGNVAGGVTARAFAGEDALDSDALSSDFENGPVGGTLGAGVQYLGTVANLPKKQRVPRRLRT